MGAADHHLAVGILLPHGIPHYVQDENEAFSNRPFYNERVYSSESFFVLLLMSDNVLFGKENSRKESKIIF